MDPKTLENWFRLSADALKGAEEAKKAMEANDLDAIKSAQEVLTRSSHKLAEAMYAKASQGAKGAGPGAGPGAE